MNSIAIGRGLLVLSMSLAGCRDAQKMHGEESAAALRADLGRAREASRRVTDQFGPRVRELVSQVAAPMAGNDPPALRSALVGFTTPGGPMTLFPTSFVAVTDREGRAMARDVPNETDDRMKGLPLKDLFSCVRGALEGRDGVCVGELPAVGAVPSRVLLVAAAPVRDGSQSVIGALAAGITFGALARMIDGAVRPGVGSAVLWTGLRMGTRVLPAGTDQDVPRRWLVPDSLIRVIPAAQANALAGTAGEHVWAFSQDGRGWGGAVGSLPTIPGAALVLFRSEANQR
jgi:hypothetical protein